MNDKIQREAKGSSRTVRSSPARTSAAPLREAATTSIPSSRWNARTIRAPKFPVPPSTTTRIPKLLILHSRQVTRRALTKPPIAIARQQSVQRIPPALRNHAQRMRHPPNSTERSHHVNRPIGFSQHPSLIEHEESGGILRI